MPWNFDGKCFRVNLKRTTAETGIDTTFHYRQRGNILWGMYEGGTIAFGTLTGLVAERGHLDFHYSHVNRQYTIASGVCQSTLDECPET